MARLTTPDSNWFEMSPESEKFSALLSSLLLFPVGVTFLVATTFLLGGRCSWWQWWGGVAVVLFATRLFVHSAVDYWKVVASFLGTLFALWIIGGILMSRAEMDQRVYHLPAIRLLIEGWNPVWQGNWDVVRDAFGIEADEVRSVMVLAMPKSVWYFNAAAYFFIRNPFNLLFPLVPFLMVSVAFSILLSFRSVHWVIQAAMICAVVGAAPSYYYCVDAAVAYSGIGLLIAMWRCIREQRWNWIEFVCYSFWMCTAKQLAMAHCVFFWVVFLVFNLFLRRGECVKRVVAVAGLVAVCWVITCVSPYLSQWMNFGHPLYPQYTVDPEKHPVVHVTSDFFDRNADAAAMGRVGAFVNSFISADLACAFYRMKLGLEDFHPNARAWNLPPDSKSKAPNSFAYRLFFSGGLKRNAPTSFAYRLFFSGGLLVLLLLGRREDRFVAGLVALSVMLVPTEMVGYVRYVPWGIILPVLALGKASKFRGARVVNLMIKPLAVVCSAYFIAVSMVGVAISVDGMAAIGKSLEESMPSVLYSRYVPLSGRHAVNTASMGNIKLLCRHVNEFVGINVIDGGTDENSVAYFDNSFCVPLDYDGLRHSSYFRLLQVRDRKKRMLAWPVFVLQACVQTMPMAIVWRVAKPFGFI